MARYYVEIKVEKAVGVVGRLVIELKAGHTYFTDYGIQVWSMGAVNLPPAGGLTMNPTELVLDLRAPQEGEVMLIGVHTTANDRSFFSQNTFDYRLSLSQPVPISEVSYPRPKVAESDFKELKRA